MYDKEARSMKKNSLASQIIEKMKVTTPDYYLESGWARLSYRFRINRRKVNITVGYYELKKDLWFISAIGPKRLISHLSLIMPSVNYNTLIKTEASLKRSAYIKQLQKLLSQRAKSFSKARAILTLVDNLNLKLTIQDDVKAAKDKILAAALTRIAASGSPVTNDISNKANLLVLLVGEDKTIRDLAKKQMQRVNDFGTDALLKPKVKLTSGGM